MFRAHWPITDTSRPLDVLIREAAPELLLIAAAAKARLTGPGVWSVADSTAVRGSGRVTPLVLLYEAPAEAIRRTVPACPILPGRRPPQQYDTRRAS